MNNKVTIIGCGALGLPLAKQLIKKGYQVKGSTTRQEKIATLEQAGIQAFLLDLNNEMTDLLNILSAEDCVVITFPPNTLSSRKPYLEQLQFLSQQLQQVGIKKVIFTSSTDVYPQKGTWVNERDAEVIKPRFTDTPVLTLEQTLSDYPSLNTTILRLAGLMGPAYNSGFHVAGREIKGANDLINLVHQDDCIAIMQKIIQRDIWGETFNVVADQHPTKRDYYNALCDIHGLTRPSYIEGSSNYRIVSNNKLKQTLEYKFIHPDPSDINLTSQF